jgi:uncharacterized protein YutE (UPF0331/DUF86 family)
MDRIIKFLENNISNIRLDRTHSGFGVRTPDFDLSSFDYLLKAEDKLLDLRTSPNDKLLKNDLIHYLKTGMECQIDTFLNSYCIDYKKLNVPKKLHILEELNIISSATLVRLNKLRNEIIHDYKLIELDLIDLEAFYDITKNLIWVLQPIMTLNYHSRLLEFKGYRGEACQMQVGLNEFAPLIQFSLSDKDGNYEIDIDLLNFKDIIDFIKYLKVQLLLSQFDSFNDKTLIVQLIKRKTASNTR